MSYKLYQIINAIFYNISGGIFDWMMKPEYSSMPYVCTYVLAIGKHQLMFVLCCTIWPFLLIKIMDCRYSLIDCVSSTCPKRVWKYQQVNQNPYIKDEQTTQWLEFNSRTCILIHVKPYVIVIKFVIVFTASMWCYQSVVVSYANKTDRHDIAEILLKKKWRHSINIDAPYPDEDTNQHYRLAK